ncbi:hypothetical protein GUJ93_ZPchr0002g24543 [Zizania palustris]|uniref:Transposase (putative) gypsy type domain-containing protein n=1 Tax=Zizania palustris TaxID=103762 RepID=A0A8J5V548_ZIZPA|nr:hypothetical protein GUJ93_ZPchr0002g24543 [Zizania palustris]
MPKKAVAKPLVLGSSSGSAQVQAAAAAAAAAKPAARRLGPRDLRTPSDRFEQTLEMRASISTEESVRRACEGKIAAKIQLRVPEKSEAVPKPRADEVVVFEAFFEAGLGLPAVGMLSEVLKAYNLELPQLSPNAVARLAVFEWAMRAEGCEGRADVFVALHDANCQPKPREGTDRVKRALAFGSANFQLRKEFQDAFPARAVNNKWYSRWDQEWFYASVGANSPLRSTNAHILYRREGVVTTSEGLLHSRISLLRRVAAKMSMRDLAEEFITLRLSPLARSWPEGLFQASGRADLDMRTPEEAIAAADRVVGTPTPEEQNQRLALVGSWERWNRVWSALDLGGLPALPDFGHLGTSSAGAKRKRGDEDEPDASGEAAAKPAATPTPKKAAKPLAVRTSEAEADARTPAAKEATDAPAEPTSGVEVDALASQRGSWRTHLAPASFQEISDDEDEDDARPPVAKPAGEGGSKPAEAKPAEASSSSSSSGGSSSESESESTSSDDEGGGGRADPRGEEDVDVVGLSPASPKPAETTVAVIHPFKPREGVTAAAILGFREACASAEEGDLVAQLSHLDPTELFVSSNEVLIRAFALNAAASTAADRRMERLAEEKEALRREVLEETEKRRRAEASAAEAKEALASETARLRAELQASKMITLLYEP